MIRGKVNAELQPLVILDVAGPLTEPVALPLLVDTGFNGHLTLSTNVIVALDLDQIGYSDSKLADGSTVRFPAFAAIVNWFDEDRPVTVLQGDEEALLGMKLLEGCRLKVESWSGGAVEIERTP